MCNLCLYYQFFGYDTSDSLKREYGYEAFITVPEEFECLGEEKGGPEGFDNGDFIRKWGFDENATSYKILLDNKTIGSVILRIDDKSNEKLLNCVFFAYNKSHD